MISGFFKRQECLVIILIMKSDNFNSLFQAYEKKNKYVPEIQHFDKMSFVTQETNNEVRCNVYKRSTFKNRWHQGFRSSLRKRLFENEISLMFPYVG